MEVAILTSGNTPLTNVVANCVREGAECILCSQPFNRGNNLPKILDCGHTFCSNCITKMLTNVQVAHYGDGSVCISLNCPTCKQSTSVEGGQNAQSFRTNYQIMDIVENIKSGMQKSCINYLTCSECTEVVNETQCHICEQCASEKHSIVIKDLEMENNIDKLAICSRCALKGHNSNGHTLLNFFKARISNSYHKIMLVRAESEAKLKVNMSSLGTTMENTPILVNSLQKELMKTLGFMKRARSTKNQEAIATGYKKEANTVNQLIEKLETALNTFNKELVGKLDSIKEVNGRMGAFSSDDPSEEEVHHYVIPTLEEVFNKVYGSIKRTVISAVDEYGSFTVPVIGNNVNVFYIFGLLFVFCLIFFI